MAKEPDPDALDLYLYRDAYDYEVAPTPPPAPPPAPPTANQDNFDENFGEIIKKSIVETVSV